MDATDQVFPSGVVFWAAWMIWSICLVMWGAGIWILIDAGPTPEDFVVAVTCLLLGAGTLGFLYRTRYTITSRELIIQSGVLRKRIKLDRIGNVSSKLTPGVNFAMSRENILQVNVQGSRLGYRISPADRDGFIRTLAQACPHLEKSRKFDCGLPPKHPPFSIIFHLLTNAGCWGNSNTVQGSSDRREFEN